MLTEIPLADAAIWKSLPRIFQAVCAPSYRWKFNEPWTDGVHVYGTDGSIAVRILLSDLPSNRAPISVMAPSHGAKDIALFFRHEWSPIEIPLPGGCVAIENCPQCRGSGDIEVFRLFSACDFCDGEGYVTTCDRVDVAPGLILNSRYIALLRAHGVTSVRRAVEPLVEQVYWRRRKIEGVLMPMNPESPTCP